MKYKEEMLKFGRIAKDFFEHKEENYEQAVHEICARLQRGHKILIFGNGGSAAQAQHFAAELVNRYLKSRRAIPALSLTTDTSALTSIANDFSYDTVFSRQLEALAIKDDIAVALSTSGESKNVIHALRTAVEKELFTLGLTGAIGGTVGSLCRFLWDVPSDETPRIQEVHLFLLHQLALEIEERVG
jgi:D-sedoheptulose 7-phosphate isomerase